jgi:D-alanine-D-alanine ligase-like ATP-grasp enzyme
MKILMVAIEAGRWGPSRLPREFKAAGVPVAALCPADNALAATRFLDRYYPLPATRSSRRVARHLAAAIADWQPQLLVPADEQTVAMLHALVRRGPSRRGLDAAALALVVNSLGSPEQFDAMLFKTRTLELAAALGVPVPRGATVDPATDPAALAEEIGYPLFVKRSFSWAGQGVTLCNNPVELNAALAAPRDSRLASLKQCLRRLLHRDWYPVATPIDVQQAINGTPAMYCVAAWQGRIVAGFAGMKEKTLSATGPSTVVRLCEHTAMAAAAATMVHAFNASGFLSFDFAIDRETGVPYLLECNPRPAQAGHLGDRVGADLAAALAVAMSGGAVRAAQGSAEIVLFPQEWQRNPTYEAPQGAEIDIPWDDPALLDYMLAHIPAQPGQQCSFIDAIWRVAKRETLPGDCRTSGITQPDDSSRNELKIPLRMI